MKRLINDACNFDTTSICHDDLDEEILYKVVLSTIFKLKSQRSPELKEFIMSVAKEVANLTKKSIKEITNRLNLCLGLTS